jgi:hypothetical protein
MPWELDGNNLGMNLTEWLGTRDAHPLIMGTQTGGNTLPTPTTEAMRITPVTGLTPGTQPRSVGIGTRAPQRRLHVEPSEIHSGGSEAGFSFGNRPVLGGQPPPFTENPTNGERWVWYATEGAARLWSGLDKIVITTDGRLDVRGDVAAAGDVSAEGSVEADGTVKGDFLDIVDFLSARSDASIGGSLSVGPTTGTTGVGVRSTSSDSTGVLGESKGIGGSSGQNIGVNGISDGGFAGVSGSSTGNAFGVRGISNTNTGVVGASTSGIGGEFNGGKAQLRLQPSSTLGRPTTGQHNQGELFMDSGAALFVCTATGTPGTWRRFTTTPA